MKQCQMWIKDKMTSGKSVRCSKQTNITMFKISNKEKVGIYLCEDHLKEEIRTCQK